jgi:YfiH family protein
MYQLQKLKQYPELIHGFSEISDGNMSFEWGEKQEVQKNRLDFFALLKLDMKNSAMMNLQHNVHVEIVDNNNAKFDIPDTKNLINADALITKVQGLVLCLLIADCLPILFYDPKKKVIAIGHLGWRGTDLKLCQKIIRKFVKDFQSDTNDIIVGIGPGIYKESYLHQNPIQKNNPGWHSYLKDLPNGQTQIDIIGYNKEQLLVSGIKKENIEISDIDTAKSKNFFSHYRASRTGEPEGRFMAILAMK